MVEAIGPVGEKLPYTCVFNVNTRMGVVTDSLGLFRINISYSDTLLFTCIGYQDFRYSLPDSLSTTVCFIHVKLSPATYELAEVDIVALTRQSQFRYDFIHLEQDPDAMERQLVIPGVSNPNYIPLSPEERNLVQSGSPISFIYSLASTKEQSKKKLVELKKHERITAQIETKYNKKQLMRFTGYDDSVTYLFMRFLDYPEDFLLKTSEYELYVDISKKMLEFEAIYKDIIPKELKKE
jgi:hypothetical protein